MSKLRKLFSIPPPEAPARRWHVSPLVDTAAYAFGWLFLLVPLQLLGQRTPTDQLTLLLLVVGLTFAHRHYTLPYVYLDRAVFARAPRRFTWFPLLMLAGFVASPFLWSSPARSVVAGVAAFAGAWNVWHVYMQKYGILRLYVAKSPSERPAPGWVDRLLLFAWVPLYLVWLGPKYRFEIEWYYPTAKDYTLPLVDAVASGGAVLVPLAIVFLLTAIGVFIRSEWQSDRLRNAPRLTMALGTTVLSAAFLVANPINVALAFAFSHAVEYMVFVWAFQRRRYRAPLPHDPLLGRILRRPWLAYGLFTLGTAGVYLVFRFYGQLIVPEASSPAILGTTAERWAFYWSVYQSMVHFYYDGFLWKMRQPELQSDL